MKKIIRNSLKIGLLVSLMFVTVSCSLIDEKNPPVSQEFKDFMDEAFSNLDTVIIQSNKHSDLRDEYLEELLKYHKKKDYEAMENLIIENELYIGTEPKIIK